MKKHAEDMKQLVAGLAQQFVGAIEETRVLTIEECASYVERKSPCSCRENTALAIRGLKLEVPTPSESEEDQRT